MVMVDRGWFRPAEGAAYVGVSVKTFYTWLDHGLKWSRVGGCRLIKRENLDAYIEGFENRADVDQIVDDVLEEMML